MDQSRDQSGRERYRLSQLLDAPEFVKNAESSDLCGDDSVPSDAYANPVHRLYPCHTQAATWASTAFFLDKKASWSPQDADYIAERLSYYAAYHGITHAINDLHAKFASAQTPPEEKLSDDDYAFVHSHKGEVSRKYPMRNSAEVKAAAAYLHTHRDHFPYQLRRDWADKVLNKAAQYGVALGEHSDYIERQAGNGYCTVKVAVDAIRDRVNAARKGAGPLSELQKNMVELADKLAAAPVKIHEPGMRVKIADVIDQFDRATGIHRQYGDKLQRVEDILFDITVEKMANAVRDHVSTLTGNIYSTSDLTKLSWEQVNNFLGDDIANAMSKNGKIDVEKAAAVVPTLDRGSARLFDEMMEAAGLQPAAKEAAAGYSLSKDYLRKMAADYQKAVVAE